MGSIGSSLNTNLRLFLCAALVSSTVGTYASANDGESPYRLGAGDVIAISVPIQETFLNPGEGKGLPIEVIGDRMYFRHQAVVAPDGCVTFPGLSTPVEVSGLTFAECRKLLTTKLGYEKSNAPIFISLARIDHQSYYVWGEVARPGRYSFDRPLTLMDALGFAGGAIYSAKLKNVSLHRAGNPPIEFDLSPKALRAHGYPSITLKASDTIVVPRKWSANSTNLAVLAAFVSAFATVAIATKD